MINPPPHVVQRFQADQITDAICFFEEHGYVIIEKSINKEMLFKFWEDVENQINTNQKLTYSLHGKIYEGSDAPSDGKKLPRIIDIESHSAISRDLLLAPVISNFFTALHGYQPTCLQTLTYKYSSEQHAHSDKSLVNPPCAHDYNRETLTASWIALEPADENNGALVIYPGSHKLPKRGFFDGFDNDYGAYTTWLYGWLAENGFTPSVFTAQPGDILFWHGDFVHAGGPIKSQYPITPTRKSLVCHYARIDISIPSRDPKWSRVAIPGGSYFQKTFI